MNACAFSWLIKLQRNYNWLNIYEKRASIARLLRNARTFK